MPRTNARTEAEDDRLAHPVLDRDLLETQEMEIMEAMGRDPEVEVDDIDDEDVLPNLPPIPGFHVCYLSTTHRSDTIYKRERMGYVPVTEDDLPETLRSPMRLKDGEYQGRFGVGEMLAYKIPIERYQRLMMLRHHTRPLDAENSLKAQAFDFMKDRRGEPLVREVGEGIVEFGGKIRTPTFTE